MVERLAMSLNEQGVHFQRLLTKSRDVNSVGDLYAFVTDLMQAWEQGVFVERDIGEDQSVLDYLSGIHGTLHSLELRERLDDETFPVDWSLVAEMLLRGFVQT